MSDFFNGLDDPTSVSLDSVDGGFYDSGTWSSNAADTNFSTGGSNPAPLNVSIVDPVSLAGVPDMAIAAAPSFLKTDPTIPVSGGSVYWATDAETTSALGIGGNISDNFPTDPLETPPGNNDSMHSGGSQTGAWYSAIGAGGAAAIKAYSQTPPNIPSNPRGAQTVGLRVPQGIPGQTLQQLGTGQASSWNFSPQSGSGVLLLIGIGVLLIWLAKR